LFIRLCNTTRNNGISTDAISPIDQIKTYNQQLMVEIVEQR